MRECEDVEMPVRMRSTRVEISYHLYLDSKLPTNSKDTTFKILLSILNFKFFYFK